MFNQKSNYVSDFTQFMRAHLEQHPEQEKGQLEGRALLWDKAPLDLEERARNEASRVKQKPYVYQSE